MEKDDTYRSQFRMPNSLFVLLRDSAKRNKRNLNSELIFRLELALKDERLDRYLSQQNMTRTEFDANALAVARAWPLETTGTDAAKPISGDELDEAIKKLGHAQREALLRLLRSFGALPNS